MATYFHGYNSDLQTADGLQNLVLMNSAAAADAPQAAAAAANSLFFLNPATGPASALPHAPPLPPSTLVTTTQQFVGVPFRAAASSQHHQDHPSSSGNPHAVHAQPRDVFPAMHGFLQRVQYGTWSSLDQSDPRREASLRPQQGLSLSLSSQHQQLQQQGFLHRGFGSDEREVPAVSGGSPSSLSGVTSGGGGGAGVSALLGSKYLKAAQELLDEVVNVRNSVIVKNESPMKGSGRSSKAGTGESSASANEDGSSGEGRDGNRAAELSTAEWQEIQMKKAKLISMLDEVEQKYKQYHHQMQIVISAFQQAAGIGSARTYTSNAPHTISKQFRCLKDAISGQIRVANKSLGEDEPPGGKIEGSSLKFVDHHIRQQRALQHLGMIQNNAWRHQRGLPERSVSILRAWLFEHFLHPYPKDSDKHMLAKQTGLTRSQVSNWFINARVRLWKPMVEEIFTEEVKDQEQKGADGKANKGGQKDDSSVSNSASPPEKSVTADNHGKNSFNPKDAALAANSMSPVGANLRNHHLSGFSFIGSSNLDGIMQSSSPKRQRSATATADVLLSSTDITCVNVEPNKRGEPITIKFGDDGHVHSRDDGYSLLVPGPANFIGGFGQYSIVEIGRFATEQQFAPAYNGNGVSLTLGPPHDENLPLSGGSAGLIPGQGIQLGRRLNGGGGNEFGTLNNLMPPEGITGRGSLHSYKRRL